jgi:hypothetical protein
MADRFSAEVTKTLHAWGCGVRTDPTAKFATKDEPGRADRMVVCKGRGCYIEIKDGYNAFSFSDLRPNQRQWIEEVALKKEQTSVWIWLVLGDSPPDRNPLLYNSRQAWLFPFSVFMEAEARVEPYSGSIPYRAGKGYRKELQEQHLDAVHIFARYALRWHKGQWKLPLPHLFWGFVNNERDDSWLTNSASRS